MNRKMIQLEIAKPNYKIEQKIFVPQRGGVLETTIQAYWIGATTENGKLLGVVAGYRAAHPLISVRRGQDAVIPLELWEKDFYANLKKAETAAKFLAVKADEKTWKLAIGDRDDEDEKSPYNTGNCDLKPCCANISEARDILIYCRKNSGLLVHDRNELKRMFEGHGYGGNSLSKILSQLRINER